MLLRELKETKPTGTYVAVLPTPSTLALVRAWADEHRFDLADDLHVTLLYSRKVVNVVPCLDEFVATGDRLEVLGGDLVLMLNCPALQARHSQLVAQGGTHDFPNYLCHMTLQKKTNLKPSEVEMPTFGLIFGNEYSEPLDP